MIINTGARTDTVRYYTKWLLGRFDEGYVYSRNPLFPNKVTRYELTPEKVDCVVFCSKDYEPILPDLARITSRFPTYFHYTITAYGTDVEPGVPSIEKSIDTLRRLSKIVGSQRVAWRYDPVLLTERYTVQTHLETFDRMAEQIAPYADRCIFGFVEMYRRLETNMPELVALTDDDKDALAKGLGESAARHGLPIQTCGASGDYTRYGIEASGCMTLDMVGKANGLAFRRLKHGGTREGCGCIQTRDIGAYNTCLSGCRYCYANKRPDKARENYKLHDPDSPLLIGHPRETDTLQQGAQRSFLANERKS